MDKRKNLVGKVITDIAKLCEVPQNNFKYEMGQNWCDCVDYTFYINVYITDSDYFTVYQLDRGGYSCCLYHNSEIVSTLENFDSAFDIIDFLGDYDLLP